MLVFSPTNCNAKVQPQRATNMPPESFPCFSNILKTDLHLNSDQWGTNDLITVHSVTSCPYVVTVRHQVMTIHRQCVYIGMYGH